MKRIPTLDGWRGIAIAMVLFTHIQGATGHNLINTGQHGVTIFFVLSGFLITKNLITRPGNLKNFYIRRFFRLMPVVWTYLALLAVVSFCTGVPLFQGGEIQPCLLFYRNYVGPNPGGAMTGHFWSLSIEEQFYLVWPGLLLLLGIRRCRWFAGLAAIGVGIYRWRMWQHYTQGLLDYRTEVRADALFLGCLLALLLSDPELRKRAAGFTKWLALPAIAGLLIAIRGFPGMEPLYEPVCIAILIAGAYMHPSSVPARVLSCKPLVWLGQVSYSIYVWQEPFMWFKGSMFGLIFLLVFFMPLFALGSYYLIERPCTQFGRRLTSENKASQIAEPQSIAV